MCLTFACSASPLLSGSGGVLPWGTRPGFSSEFLERPSLFSLLWVILGSGSARAFDPDLCWSSDLSRVSGNFKLPPLTCLSLQGLGFMPH